MTRDEMRVFYGSDKGWKTYKLDRVVTDNIAEFDVMCVMKPFSWEFTL